MLIFFLSRTVASLHNETSVTSQVLSVKIFKRNPADIYSTSYEHHSKFQITKQNFLESKMVKASDF